MKGTESGRLPSPGHQNCPLEERKALEIISNMKTVYRIIALDTKVT